MDRFEIDRAFVIGGSGGGPHALACAALLPERVIAAATVASLAPFNADGLDFLAGTGPENVEEFTAAVHGKEELQSYLEREIVPLATLSGEEIASSLGGLISGPDRAVLTGPFADAMARQQRDAVRSGIWGWFDDDMAFIQDWGFDLEAIRLPVTLWHGEEDLMSPLAHGRWLAARIPGIRTRIEPGAGHISIAVSSYGLILDSLLALGA
jgi:pimeloyl-ACP methyl ester carboxylesterase